MFKLFNKMLDMFGKRTFTLIREKAICDQISNSVAVLGILYDNQKKEICRSLESSKYLIPEGIYDCKEDETGKHRYWKISDVQNRTNIEIHEGNFVDDTRGCPLFGEEWCIMSGQLAINNSRVTLDRLKNKSILPKLFKIDIKNKDK